MSNQWTLITDTGDDTVPERQFDTEAEAKAAAEAEVNDCGPVEWHTNPDTTQTGDPVGTDSAAGWWYTLVPPRGQGLGPTPFTGFDPM